jgi:hypothetical protein
MANLIRHQLQNNIADIKNEILQNVEQRMAKVEQQVVEINEIAVNME